MTQRVDSRGQVWINVPNGATLVDKDGVFWHSQTTMKGVHGCPELKPTEHVEWYRWDTYHKSWAVYDSGYARVAYLLT